jgi:hypothetical protein
MKSMFIALCTVAVALVAGVAFAQTGDESTVIHACKHPSGGWLRQVSEPAQCRRRETAVSWNVAGAKGEKGIRELRARLGRLGRRAIRGRSSRG